MKFFIVCLLAGLAYADVESNGAVSGELAACDFGQCLSTCISNGWKFGYCSGDKCVCKVKSSGDSLEISSLTNVALHDNGVVAVNCDNGACMRACWAFGWAGGRCSGASCRCYRSANEEQVDLKQLKSNVALCDFGRCLSACVSSGWRTGYCQGNNCVCQGRRSVSTENLTTESDDGVEVNCDVKACMTACWAYGWAGGRCAGGSCQCYRVTNDENKAEVALNQLEPKKDDGVAVNCDINACMRACWAYGWAGGRCAGGSCQCYRVTNDESKAEVALNELEPKKDDGVAVNCDIKACMRACWAFGWAGGRCAGGSCLCYRVTNDENKAEVVLNELEPNKAACDFGRCLRTCTSNGWRTGYCQGNNCVCQGRRSVSMKNLAIPSGKTVNNETASCDANNCILYCQRMGKTAGKCIGGRCWCI